jgi:predicted membrane channel-forming protein YqfA (hemolysin III family)
MTKRTRKLIGTVLILIFICLYAPIAMAIAEGRILEAPKLVQTLAYIALGLVWVLPVMPLIRWMEKPDKV